MVGASICLPTRGRQCERQVRRENAMPKKNEDPNGVLAPIWTDTQDEPEPQEEESGESGDTTH